MDGFIGALLAFFLAGLRRAGAFAAFFARFLVFFAAFLVVLFPAFLAPRFVTFLLAFFLAFLAALFFPFFLALAAMEVPPSDVTWKRLVALG